MGPDLELVVLEMTEEDQMERVRTRARGSEQAVEILKVRFYMHFRFWLAGRSKIAMLSMLQQFQIIAFNNHVLGQGFMKLCKPAEPGEPQTRGIRVTREMSRHCVMNMIIEHKSKE